jgi:alkylation response protein AidB-like acyl-CoA dehydrogenase
MSCGDRAMLRRDVTEEQTIFRDAYRNYGAIGIVPQLAAGCETGIADRDIEVPDATGAVISQLSAVLAKLGIPLRGGIGDVDEYPVSRQYTHAKISVIYAGRCELMKIISRERPGDNEVTFNSGSLRIRR